jgi:hypothetical protein
MTSCILPSITAGTAARSTGETTFARKAASNERASSRDGQAIMRRVAAAGLATCAWLLTGRAAFAQSGAALEPTRVSLTSVHHYVATDAIPRQLAAPPNLIVPDMYRSVVDAMLRGSPTFRRQCVRISAEPALTVHIAIPLTPRRSDVRAQTRLTRNAGHLTALVAISPFQDLEELIAHELEHVIEQLDGIDLQARAARPRTGVNATGARDAMFETVRAQRAGLTVASELR